MDDAFLFRGRGGRVGLKDSSVREEVEEVREEVEEEREGDGVAVMASSRASKAASINEIVLTTLLSVDCVCMTCAVI